MSAIRTAPASSVVRRVALAAAGACALVFGAVAQERGRLLAVEAGGDAAASSVAVIGDRPLSFTTLKLRDPPRVVVDFADTELAGVQRDLRVEDGTVRRVATATVGQRTARVVIELAAEAEFDVQADGNRVEVRVPRAPLIAAEPTGAAPQSGPAAAEAPPGTAPAVPPAEDADARKRREAAERAEALATARRAAIERATAAQKAARERRAAAAAEEEARRRAVAERAAAAKQARLLAAKKKAVPAKEQRKRATAENARPPPPPAAVAKTTPAVPARKPPPQRKLAMAAPRHVITGIGFRPIGAGEVIVRSDHPLEYGVSRGDDAVLLHLPSAAIPLPNNRRPLDTRFFNGPVQRVVPVEVAGGTDLRIELRGRAEYQLAQSGTVLTVTFSAPR